MKVYIVEGGEYEEKCIIGVYSSREKAIREKEKWDKNNSYQGAVIPIHKGGDGIKCYRINDARITEYEIE